MTKKKNAPRRTGADEAEMQRRIDAVLTQGPHAAAPVTTGTPPSDDDAGADGNGAYSYSFEGPDGRPAVITVHDLAALLGQFPPDLPVVLAAGGEGNRYAPLVAVEGPVDAAGIRDILLHPETVGGRLCLLVSLK